MAGRPQRVALARAYRDKERVADPLAGWESLAGGATVPQLRSWLTAATKSRDANDCGLHGSATHRERLGVHYQSRTCLVLESARLHRKAERAARERDDAAIEEFIGVAACDQKKKASQQRRR